MLYSEAFKILEIYPPYSEEDLKLAYKKKAKIHHPDIGGKEALFILVNNAYELLKTRGGESYADPLEEILTRCVGRNVVNSIKNCKPHQKERSQNTLN